MSDSVRKEVDELLTRLTKSEQHDLLETLRERFKSERAELRRVMLGHTQEDEDYVFDPTKHKAEFVPPRTVIDWDRIGEGKSSGCDKASGFDKAMDITDMYIGGYDK